MNHDPPGNAAGADASETLHPAEHRAYRELSAAGRQLTSRWERLLKALEGTPDIVTFDHALKRVKQLLAEVEEQTSGYGLGLRPAAQAVGAGLASARGAMDSSVDTGMVLRFAVLDIEHVATLVAHLAELARARGDERLAAFNRKWEQILRPEVKAIRKVAINSGADPDRAGAPINDSLLAKAAHATGWVLGSVGEAVDRISLRRSGD